MTKNKMWGGRFAQGPSEIMKDINVSIDFDQRLYAQDIMASKAHARMLGKRGIIAGIRFFYEGDENWPVAVPTKGRAAEQGCVGCGWYDIPMWRTKLNEAVASQEAGT